MKLDDKAKETVDYVRTGYIKAEGEVDGFFARNKYTVVILSAVALALVAGAYFGLKATFFCS